MMTMIQHDQPTEDVRLHPRTGELLKPLFMWHGGAVWPVLGGADGDDDDSADADSDSDDTDTGDDTGDGDGKDGSKDQVSREDFDKLRKQLQASDKNKAALEKRMKELDDKDKSELVKATERVTELEDTITKQSKELGDLRLQNAFLSADTGVTWHDPGDALALAERKGYLSEVVGEDGKVDSDKLKTKLKEMAKASPHLVKSGGSSDSGSGGSNSVSTKTGGAVGTKSKGNQDKGPDLSRYSRFLNT